jgi:riboflavin biosynthesis pyrimidine reductase
MIYSDLTFPTYADRPFFYTNFVQTLDGKIQVISDPKGYWPLGSAEDYDTLIGLRAYADVLIHGRHTATWVRAMDRLGNEDFQGRRKSLGKTGSILYLVISGHPSEDLLSYLENPPSGVDVLLVTPEDAVIPSLLSAIPTIRLGKNSVDMNLLSEYLHRQSKQKVLVEGGPHVLGHFLKNSLIDELFVTIAPKIIGNLPGQTLTLVEGFLFSTEQVPSFELQSTLVHESELYLRYRKPQ